MISKYKSIWLLVAFDLPCINTKTTPSNWYIGILFLTDRMFSMTKIIMKS
jgi:hypothetical protein